MNENRTRNEKKCRSVISKDRRYSPKLNEATSTRFIRYCELMNVNKAMTAAEAINYYLDAVERKALESKSKEELIEIVLRR